MMSKISTSDQRLYKFKFRKLFFASLVAVLQLKWFAPLKKQEGPPIAVFAKSYTNNFQYDTT